MFQQPLRSSPPSREIQSNIYQATLRAIAEKGVLSFGPVHSFIWVDLLTCADPLECTFATSNRQRPVDGRHWHRCHSLTLSPLRHQFMGSLSSVFVRSMMARTMRFQRA
jgi:hypothetical protein